jgi:hypothetical protein
MDLQVGAAITGSTTLEAASPNTAVFNLETKFIIIFSLRTKRVFSNLANKT